MVAHFSILWFLYLCSKIIANNELKRIYIIMILLCKPDKTSWDTLWLGQIHLHHPNCGRWMKSHCREHSDFDSLEMIYCQNVGRGRGPKLGVFLDLYYLQVGLYCIFSGGNWLYWLIWHNYLNRLEYLYFDCIDHGIVFDSKKRIEF